MNIECYITPRAGIGHMFFTLLSGIALCLYYRHWHQDIRKAVDLIEAAVLDYKHSQFCIETGDFHIDDDKHSQEGPDISNSCV